MIITREKGMRMWGGGSGSTSASGVNGGGGFSLAVEEGEGTGNAYTDFTYESGTLTLNKATEFVTVDFFNKLFTAYDANGNVISPNNTTPTLDNIKFKAGAWTEQYLSALGQNSSGGGGGGGIELSDVWQSLKTNTDDYANQKINLAHIPDLSGTYATKTWVNQQGFVTSSGVTSVAMTVPTGLSVSGSPITSTGTLALTFATGYSIPTTTKQGNWDTAYGWGNHATAGYASASSVTTLQGYFTDGVAKVAAKLNTGTTTYTAWGQTYWSSGVPQSISGNMTSVGNITPSANGNALGTTSARFNIYGTAGNFSGNVSIGGALSVTSGITLTTTKKIYFGDTSHYLELDSTGFHFSHGVYSDSFVSALGANSSGGGSGTFDEEAMWTALGTTISAKVIASSHIPNIAWNNITGKPAAVGDGNNPIYWNGSTFTICNSPSSGNYFRGVPSVRTDGVMEIGRYIDFHSTNDSTIDYNIRLDAGTSTESRVFTFPSTGGTLINSGNYSSYALPLSGGTMSNTNLVTNLNADLLDGQHASYFAAASSLSNYVTLTTAQTISGDKTFTGSIIMGNNHSIFGANESGGAMSYFDGSRTVIGSVGATSTKATHLRSITGHLTVGNSNAVSYNVLDSGNYTDYTVTKTGTGASGTWGISVTGNADSTTKLQTPRTIWGQSFDGTANVSGTLTDTGTILPLESVTHDIGSNALAYRYVYATWVGSPTNKILQFGANNQNHITVTTDGNVGIGTTSTSYKLHVAGNTYVSNSITAGGGLSAGYIELKLSTPFIDFHFNNSTADYTSRIIESASGTLTVSTNLVASGEVTASSDERKKDIIRNTQFNIRDIASARSVIYKWNDDRDNGCMKKIHGGSIAQDWIGKADSFLSQDGDGFYSINYGALALCSAITIAREVIKHDDEITRLKKEVVKLRERVAELEERRIA